MYHSDPSGAAVGRGTPAQRVRRLVAGARHCYLDVEEKLKRFVRRNYSARQVCRGEDGVSEPPCKTINFSSKLSIGSLLVSVRCNLSRSLKIMHILISMDVRWKNDKKKGFFLFVFI